MGEMRLTRGEYWLLETAVEYGMSLHTLVHPEIECALNKPGHGLSRPDLIRTLVRLARRGWIDFGTLRRRHVALTRPEIEAALDRRDGAVRWYRLTRWGAAVWEAFAAPDWNRYIRYDERPIEGDTSGTSDFTIVCADRKRLRIYLASLWREGDLEKASVVSDEVSRWRATYWKRLPHGYRTRFRFRHRTELWGPQPACVYADSWYRWR